MARGEEQEEQGEEQKGRRDEEQEGRGGRRGEAEEGSLRGVENSVRKRTRNQMRESVDKRIEREGHQAGS